QGTGLGLSMVHGLAAQLGGGLSIDSEIGRGTSIHLWLPATDAKPAQEVTAEIEMSGHDRGVALVVDDEDLVRASTAHMLTELGYWVLEAGSGEEAIQLLDGPQSIDLLVTDHLMPGISGTELAMHLRQARPDIRVLVISGYAESQGVASDLPRLTKPFKQSDLASSLARL
ncbi:MAG: response regulator, partial [Sphingobium sp.]